MTTLHKMTSTDNIGEQQYPFLQAFPYWEIQASPLANPRRDAETSLRWVKDDKVLDLVAEDERANPISFASFCQATGIQFTDHANLFVQSKRLSRILSPFTYYNFFSPSDVDIQHDPTLNPAVWDGAGLINRAFLPLLTTHLPHSDEGDRLRRELLACDRFEITILHADGQEKGHVLVGDTLEADFFFPVGSTKPEISLANRVFVGVRPVHSRDEMRIDVQSLVNLYPFFAVENLLGWLHNESDLFLTGIREGEIDDILGRLERFDSECSLHQFRRWTMGEYIASGGRLMWFPGAIKAMARQHSQRILNGERKLRLPIPGGRFYLMPTPSATVMCRQDTLSFAPRPPRRGSMPKITPTSLSKPWVVLTG